MEFISSRKDLGKGNVAGTWKLILTQSEIKSIVKKCANVINEKFEGKNIVIVCLLKGAAYFFVDLTRELIIPYSTYFIEASSYRNKQTQDEEIEILSKIVPSKFIDKHVILIDELYDTGNTIEKVKIAIHDKAAVPYDKIFMCTLFKKNKESTNPDPDFYGIDVPNVWLVGYGLDDNQEKRGWTYLFACPKCKGVPESRDDLIFTDEIFYEKIRNYLIAESNELKIL